MSSSSLSFEFVSSKDSNHSGVSFNIDETERVEEAEERGCDVNPELISFTKVKEVEMGDERLSPPRLELLIGRVLEEQEGDRLASPNQEAQAFPVGVEESPDRDRLLPVRESLKQEGTAAAPFPLPTVSESPARRPRSAAKGVLSPMPDEMEEKTCTTESIRQFTTAASTLQQKDTAAAALASHYEAADSHAMRILLPYGQSSLYHKDSLRAEECAVNSSSVSSSSSSSSFAGIRCRSRTLINRPSLTSSNSLSLVEEELPLKYCKDPVKSPFRGDELKNVEGAEINFTAELFPQESLRPALVENSILLLFSHECKERDQINVEAAMECFVLASCLACGLQELRHRKTLLGREIQAWQRLSVEFTEFRDYLEEKQLLEGVVGSLNTPGKDIRAAFHMSHRSSPSQSPYSPPTYHDGTPLQRSIQTTSEKLVSSSAPLSAVKPRRLSPDHSEKSHQRQSTEPHTQGEGRMTHSSTLRRTSSLVQQQLAVKYDHLNAFGSIRTDSTISPSMPYSQESGSSGFEVSLPTDVDLAVVGSDVDFQRFTSPDSICRVSAEREMYADGSFDNYLEIAGEPAPSVPPSQRMVAVRPTSLSPSFSPDPQPQEAAEPPRIADFTRTEQLVTQALAEVHSYHSFSSEVSSSEASSCDSLEYAKRYRDSDIFVCASPAVRAAVLPVWKRKKEAVGKECRGRKGLHAGQPSLSGDGCTTGRKKPLKKNGLADLPPSSHKNDLAKEATHIGATVRGDGKAVSKGAVKRAPTKGSLREIEVNASSKGKFSKPKQVTSTRRVAEVRPKTSKKVCFPFHNAREEKNTVIPLFFGGLNVPYTPYMLAPASASLHFPGLSPAILPLFSDPVELAEALEEDVVEPVKTDRWPVSPEPQMSVSSGSTCEEDQEEENIKAAVPPMPRGFSKAILTLPRTSRFAPCSPHYFDASLLGEENKFDYAGSGVVGSISSLQRVEAMKYSSSAALYCASR